MKKLVNINGATLKKAMAMLMLFCVACFATGDEMCNESYERFYYIGLDSEEYYLELIGDVYYDKTKNKPYDGKIRIDECGEIYYGNMKDGKPDGEYKKFYANGKLQSVRNYKDGKPYGEWKDFYESGKLQIVWNYKDGGQQIERKDFYANGKLQSVSNYKNNKPHGEWKEFDVNENLIKVKNYKDGMEQ